MSLFRHHAGTAALPVEGHLPGFDGATRLAQFGAADCVWTAWAGRPRRLLDLHVHQLAPHGRRCNSSDDLPPVRFGIKTDATQTREILTSSTSTNFAAILLLLLLTVEFGGGSLLTMLTRRIPGYLDNPLRQNMFRAGHAHPGVWLVLGLVGMLYIDQARLSGGLKSVVRVTLLVAPILMSLGFSLSVLSPKAERPNGFIILIYLGALSLAVGVLTLGVGLFQA